MNTSNPAHRVLIVDDTELNVNLLVDYLGAFDFETKACFTGEQALELLRNEHFDLALLDIKLPDMDGFELLQKAKAQGSFEVPVIFMTAFHDVNRLASAFELGAMDYVTKPLDLNVLKTKIMVNIEHSKAV